MRKELSSLTIRELIIELARIEEQIQITQAFTSTTDSAGEHQLVVSAELIELAGREHEVSAELTVRRRDLRRAQQARAAALAG